MDTKTREKFRKNILLDRASGCWMWTGTRHTAGYCVFYDPSRLQTKPAHVITIKLFSGKRIPKGYELHHRCRNKTCVNPRHCIIVSHKEHMGLHAHTGVWNGTRNGNSKLTDNEVLAMRFLDYLGIFPKQKLAQAFGVPYRTFFSVVKREA